MAPYGTLLVTSLAWPDHRLYTPYGCETAARANRFISVYAGFTPLTFSSVTVRQEILTAIKLDEFDELFVSSIFNSSNFY